MSDAAIDQRGNELPPLTAIAIVVAVSAIAFAGELAVADHLPWGEEARGVVAVLLGAITALWLTMRRGGSVADIGLVRPKRWWTVPFWVLGIFVTFVAAQALVPQLLAPYFDLPPPDMSRYDFLRGNAPAAIAMALLLPLTAAIPTVGLSHSGPYRTTHRLSQTPDRDSAFAFISRCGSDALETANGDLSSLKGSKTYETGTVIMPPDPAVASTGAGMFVVY